MSSAPDEQLGHRSQDVRASEIEALADQLVELVEEFEATISQGRVPPEFAERLAQLRQTAEHLINL